MAKKQQGALNLFQSQQGSNQYNNVGSGSDSDPSPSFTSPDYMAMMQQWIPEQQQMSDALGISDMPQQREHRQMDHRQMHGLPLSVPADAFQNYPTAQHLGGDQFNSPEEMNRRTMTQEQFDAIARNSAMMVGSGDFEAYQNQFSSDSGVWGTAFPGMQESGPKHQEAYSFPHPVGAPLSSYDSTVPSTISDQSMPAFPSSNQMQSQHLNASASSSEWGDSRSSSICVSQSGEGSLQASASTSQWQPGQSVPVDFNALNEEFRQAAQARDRQNHNQEQPLAWPDDSYTRRDSQNTMMLAAGMSNVGIHTPHPAQTATFKSPAPSANIAARRQRRPAPIGLGAMRSQSHTNLAAPLSPGQAQQQNLPVSGQQVRRIRSSNTINNGVAHGRVMKSGSAQRSPLSWTFADSINSPRHMSGQSSLAPPTPMTPQEATGQEQFNQFQAWQAASGQAVRHPSINETDAEHDLPYQPSASVPPQRFSSPPHTPSYYQQQFVQHRFGNNFIMENTPPQSAPASQMCFPSNTFAQPQPQPQAPPQPHFQEPPMPQHSQSQSWQQSSMPAPAAPQPQPYPPPVSAAASTPSSNLQTVTFAPTQHAPVTSGPPPGIPLQFANGIPMVDDDGNITMAFPNPMQFVPEPPQPQQQQQPIPMLRQPQPQQLHTPPQQPHPYYASASASPNMQVTAQLPKQAQQPAQEFFVHEYSPPEELKRSATPRKTVDTGPKNYVFANTGPDSWEKQAKKSESKSSSLTASNSPAGSSASAP